MLIIATVALRVLCIPYVRLSAGRMLCLTTPTSALIPSAPSSFPRRRLNSSSQTARRPNYRTQREADFAGLIEGFQRPVRISLGIRIVQSASVRPSVAPPVTPPLPFPPLIPAAARSARSGDCFSFNIKIGAVSGGADSPRLVWDLCTDSL